MNPLIFVGDVTPVASMEAYMNPSTLNRIVDNGSYRTPTFSVIVNNGSGNYTYGWSYEVVLGPATVSITNNTQDTAYLNVSAYNRQVTVRIQCDVTDNDTSDLATCSANIRLEFGNESVNQF